MKIELGKHQIEVSDWNQPQKIFAVITGLTTFILVLINELVLTNIIGAIYLFCGLFLFSMGIRELNIYQKPKGKFNLIIALIFIIFFLFGLKYGIENLIILLV